jgi:hypothetical protein
MNATAAKPRRRPQPAKSLPMWLTLVAQVAESKSAELQEGAK